MRLVLSPYEIGASPAAMAALILTSDDAGVLTLLPAPFAGGNAASVRGIAPEAPSYARFIDSWRWTGPLWQEGMLRAAREGADLARDLARAGAAIAADRALAAVGPMIRPELFEDEARYLEHVSRDLLRGGVDPGISLPLMALTEQIAAQSESPLVFGERSGGIWKARAPMAGSGRPAFTFSMPVPASGSGESVLALREGLEESIGRLRDAIAAALAELRRDRLNGEADLVARAASDYEREFARFTREHRPRCEYPEAAADSIRVVVSVSRVRQGHAIRQAVARLERYSPVERRGPGVATHEPAALLSERPGSLTVMRVRKSAWDVHEAD